MFMFIEAWQAAYFILPTLDRISCKILVFYPTTLYDLFYGTDNLNLCGYSDSDKAGSVDDRKSTTCYFFSLGSIAISWSSKKQASTALSSSEAEYMAVTSAAFQAVWLQRILEDMNQKQKATIIYCDNQSTIAMTKNPVYHNRTRHIKTRHHFIRELVSKGSIQIMYCSTNDQLADMFTKPLLAAKFEYFREMIGVVNFCIKGEC